MERKVGTVSRGIRCPIIRQGDDLVKIVVDSVLEAAESEKFDIRDRDVVAITESIVARSQGNYADIEAIGQDVRNKLGTETIGVIFPILSRNRFSTCLKGISLAAKKIILMLSFPRDEVGNQLLTEEQLDEHHIDPYQTVLSLEEYPYLAKISIHLPALIMWIITKKWFNQRVQRWNLCSQIRLKKS